MLKINDFEFGKVISRSQRSIIMEAKNLKTGEQLTAKFYRIPDHKNKAYSYILNEVVLMAKSNNHPNLVKFYGFCEKTMFDPALKEEYVGFYIVLERMEKSLKEEIKERKLNKNPFKLEEIKSFLLNLFPACIHLENLNIAQQDIKTKNILKKTNIYKIGDIWSGKNLYGNSDFTYEKSYEGTLSYFSPEKIENFAKNTAKSADLLVSDVFSFGLVLLKLCSLEKIKGLNRGVEAMAEIEARIQKIEKNYNNSDLAGILKECLVIDPNKRKKFSEIEKLNVFQELFREKLMVDPNKNLIKDPNNNSISPNIVFVKNDEVEKMIVQAERLRKNCQFSNSLDVYNACLKLKTEEGRGKLPEDLQSSDVLYGLGHVCIELGNYKKGLELHEKCLEIRLKIQGVDQKYTADSFNSMGVAYHGQGNFQKGLEYFEKALRIYEKLFGDTSKEAALGYNNLGGSYSLIGNHDKALEYKLKALNIKLSLIGEDSEDTAWSYDNVGVEYSELGQKEKALDFKNKVCIS